jgi:hypothetical protein
LGIVESDSNDATCGKVYIARSREGLPWIHSSSRPEKDKLMLSGIDERRQTRRVSEVILICENEHWYGTIELSTEEHHCEICDLFIGTSEQALPNLRNARNHDWTCNQEWNTNMRNQRPNGFFMTHWIKKTAPSHLFSTEKSHSNRAVRELDMSWL